jgi:uncharacterized protein YndB with AHSA1/START domain
MVSTVLVALRVKTTPARAFEAFTDEIGLWWRPHPLFQITPRGDGALKFEPGPEGRLVTELPDGKVHELGRIKIWAPGERLVVGWRPGSVPPEQATELEVRFEAVGEETRVTVEHRGWDRVERENAARHGFPDAPFLQHTARWWQAELASLARRIDDTP